MQRVSSSQPERAHRLEQLLHQRQDLWRARSAVRSRQVLATGFPELDHALHDGGWPLGATTELLAEGLNWPLLWPALQQRTGYLLLINPPLLPSASYLARLGWPAERLWVIHNTGLRDSLWAADLALRAGCCALVCQWLPLRGVTDRDLRQLQQAAARGGSWHLLVRPKAAGAQASPAALRLEAQPAADGLALTVLKQRGGWAGQKLVLNLWPELRARTMAPLAEWPVHLEPLPQLPQRTPVQRSATLASLVNG
ncbi:SOS cell division inhibitor SulA [Simiduia sp. 21SJ11W-1]|uniref:SOS cell division inhibitor SulA n=1 Tax=Simiduia sp. 21SJ11W-1 TaxID=2909669 RepID=UPI00209E52B7|nr:SOS cell division inhibitor SulA [Simiduia sp. 21SJ11W-1]UTA46429.1 SOS cell division inhibitor SulA [Simiduia sp. 21SJ11W-1]